MPNQPPTKAKLEMYRKKFFMEPSEDFLVGVLNDGIADRTIRIDEDDEDEYAEEADGAELSKFSFSINLVYY